MKCLYFLLFVAVAQGYVKRATLSAPVLTKLTALDGPSFQVDWKPVHSGDPSDPVVGYKVKVWEVEPRIVLKKEIIDGVETWVERVESQEISDNKPLTTKPKEYITDKTTFVVRDVKFNVTYETRIQAYTKRTEGPLSNALRINMHGDAKRKTKKLHKDANARLFYWIDS